MKRLLMSTAAELKRRGAPRLAHRCRVVATNLPEADELDEAPVMDDGDDDWPARESDAGVTDYPEADSLPPNPEGSEWDEDWELKTGDYGGNLRVPPYDKPRPRTKGDEGGE